MRVPSIWLDALAVVFPVHCAGCGESDRVLCGDCQRLLDSPPVLLSLAELPPVASTLRYEGAPRRAVLGFKEQGRTDVAAFLAPPLAAALAAVLTVTDSGSVEVATVPPSRSAIRRRGFDPLALLLRRAHIPVGRSVLRRMRRTDRQKTLDRAARSTNLVDSLRAREPLAGRRFVLVDDVVTTGATLREAVRALEAAGAVVVGAATLAWTPEHRALASAQTRPRLRLE